MDKVIARLSVVLGMDNSEFLTGSTKAQRELGSLRDKFGELGRRWTETGKKMTLGISAPLTAFGVLSAKTASDAAELQSAFDQTFGSLSKSMNAWAEATGDAMGRSTQELQRGANTFGIFFNQAASTRKEAAEMSKTFTVLTQDLASFYNVAEGDALQKLRSGLSGEAEPLRDFGVFLTAANVEARALEMGLADASGEISEQAKILARYNLILEGTKNAQGDVARTSGGTANQARAFSAALEELRVEIGERLLPVVTPLIKGLTRILNGFNNLPEPVKTAAVIFAGLAASIGPMMLVMATLATTVLPLFLTQFGAIGTAISFVINPIGTLITLFGKLAVSFASLTALKSLGALLLRFAGPIGIIATLGALIYQNWDRIAPVFQRFWASASQALGPPLQELIATVRDILNELWSGPLGDGIRTVIGFLGELWQGFSAAFGDTLIALLRAALEVVLYVVRQIGTAISLVTAILRGDWAGAWEAAKQFVVNAITVVRNVIEALAPGAIDAMRRLFVGVRTWLQDKLGAVFDWVSEKIETVKRGFFNLYDAVVGNSYVPDMVDGIEQHFARLDSVMVDPASRATRSVGDRMRQMASETRALLARLFPEVERLMNYRSDLGLIAGSGLSSGQQDEARRRLAGLTPGYRHSIETEQGSLIDNEKLRKNVEDFNRTVMKMGDKAKEGTVRVAQSFRQMAQDTISSVQNMVSAIKGGGFFDILGGVLDFGLQLASMGAFGKGMASRVNGSVPGYATGTRNHPGGLAWVGERGPELVSMPRGSSVFTNSESRQMMQQRQVVEIVDTTGLFKFRVDKQIGEVAPTIMEGGAQIARARAIFSSSRRLA